MIFLSPLYFLTMCNLVAMGDKTNHCCVFSKLPSNIGAADSRTVIRVEGEQERIQHIPSGVSVLSVRIPHWLDKEAQGPVCF